MCTINGMLLEELEEIPEIGTQVRVSHYEMELQDNMIKQVRVKPIQST